MTMDDKMVWPPGPDSSLIRSQYEAALRKELYAVKIKPWVWMRDLLFRKFGKQVAFIPYLELRFRIPRINGCTTVWGPKKGIKPTFDTYRDIVFLIENCYPCFCRRCYNERQKVGSLLTLVKGEHEDN